MKRRNFLRCFGLAIPSLPLFELMPMRPPRSAHIKIIHSYDLDKPIREINLMMRQYFGRGD